MAFQRATFGDFQANPFTLHRVSVFDGDLRVIQRDRADLFALFFCLIQTLGDQGVGVFIEHSDILWHCRMRLRLIIRPGSWCKFI